MTTRTIARAARLGLLLTLATISLVACSSDEPAAPQAVITPSAADAWQRELDALASQPGAAILLADLEPLLRDARDAYLAETDKASDAFFLAAQKTMIETVPPFPPPVLNMIISYKGVGTHLGLHHGESPSAVDVTVFPWVQSGASTFVAADGSELYAEYLGTALPTSEVGDVGFEGAFTFTGGTGRFVGATGGGQYQGTANQVAARGEIVWWGTLNVGQN